MAEIPSDVMPRLEHPSDKTTTAPASPVLPVVLPENDDDNKEQDEAQELSFGSVASTDELLGNNKVKDIPYVMSDNDKKSYEKFGNNFFILWDGIGNACKGVMLELPAFSMSTKWNESPAAAMAEALLKYVNKPEFEFLATKNNQNYKVLRRSGNLTSKVYESTDAISFELSFRCYSGQEFGNDTNLSSADKWKSFLDQATIKELKSDKLVDRIIGNMGAVAAAAVNQSFDLIGDIKSALKGAATKDDEDGLWNVEDFEKIREIYNDVSPSIIYRHKVTGKEHEVYALEYWGGLRDYVEKHNDEVKRNAKERSKLAEEQLKKIQKTINENKGRVTNSSEKYGAQLYKLTIYPFIFKEPLIIYVSSWTIKPSKEWNEKIQSYYYYDFTLSCSMDQIPSSLTWMSILR